MNSPDWKLTTLGEACDVNPPKPKISTLPDDTPVLFVPMASVDDVSGSIASAEQRPLGAVRSSSYRTFAPGDVLFAKITPSMENGKAAVVPSIPTRLGFGSTEFHVLRPRDGTDSRYIWHFVRQESFRRQAKGHMTGSVGQSRVPPSFLDAHLIYLPSKEVQVEIADILDSAGISIRDAGDRLAAASRGLQRLNASIIAAACSGRLTSEWRLRNPQEPVPDAPALSGTGSDHASGAPNTDELGEIPHSWTWWPVEAAMERVIDYRGRTPPTEPAGPIPHLRTTQIRDGSIDWNTNRFVSTETYNRYMTRGIPAVGDVLFTMEAPMGQVGIVDRDERFSLAQRILVMRPGERLRADFLALVLRSDPVRRALEYRATGSGVSGIAYKRLRSVLLPLPPMAEQGEIVRLIAPQLESAKRLRDLVSAAEERVRVSLQALSAKAFRGELLLS